MSTHVDSRASSSTPPAGAAAKTFLGHPRGLFFLFLVEMWERFSYYGMRGLLVLYLTAALAAHQLEKGTYENTLRLSQQVVASDEEEKAKIEHPSVTVDIPLRVLVGDAAANPTGTPVAIPGGLLTFQRLVEKDDPKNPGHKAWEPSADGLAAPSFAVKAGERPKGEPLRFRVTNTTDRKVKLTMKILRPYPPDQREERAKKARDKALTDKKSPTEADEAADDARWEDDTDYKVYFRVNDSTSVVSTKISREPRPDDAGKKLEGVFKPRDLLDDPFELTLDINRIDSGRSWTKADAGTLYGWYTGMAYLLPILGGFIADKLIGTHRSMIVGSLLITLGHLALGFSGFGRMAMDMTGMSVYVFGLAIITIGTGHFKPSVSVMVGELYPLGDPRRESAFSIFYMGINLGAFLCNFVCGYLAETYGWHYGFGAAAAGMIAGLLTYLFFKPVYLQGIGETDSPHRGKAWMFLPIGILLAIGIAFLFKLGVLRQFDNLMGNQAVYATLLVAALGGAVWFIARQEPGDRGPVATIFIYMLFNAIFWLSFEQAGSSLTVFTDELTDRRFAFIWDKIPTAQFQSVNPFLIIVLAPIFGVFWAALAKRKKSIAQPYKIGLGLIFVALGYVVMVFAAMRLSSGVSKVSMIYICGCYFLHTVGEIILSPTGLSYVAKTAPKKHLSGLMGVWFISSFVAGLAAGKVSTLVDPIIEGKVKLPWKIGGQADFFLLFVLASLAAGALVILAGFILTRLQRQPTD